LCLLGNSYKAVLCPRLLHSTFLSHDSRGEDSSPRSGLRSRPPSSSPAGSSFFFGGIVSSPFCQPYEKELYSAWSFYWQAAVTFFPFPSFSEYGRKFSGLFSLFFPSELVLSFFLLPTFSLFPARNRLSADHLSARASFFIEKIRILPSSRRPPFPPSPRCDFYEAPRFGRPVSVRPRSPLCREKTGFFSLLLLPGLSQHVLENDLNNAPLELFKLPGPPPVQRDTALPGKKKTTNYCRACP